MLRQDSPIRTVNLSKMQFAQFQQPMYFLLLRLHVASSPKGFGSDDQQHIKAIHSATISESLLSWPSGTIREDVGMASGLAARSNRSVLASVICCSVILLCVSSSTRAQDKSDKADAMLDNLRKRSAEERWERIKKMHPNDPPAPRRKLPMRLPDGRQMILPEEDLPPSPEEATLLPRLSSLPSNEPNDWVLPARQPAIDEISNEKVASAVETDTTVAADNVSGANRIASSADPDTTKAIAADKSIGGMRPLRKRNMQEIKPYYDRDKDSDIRTFAIEKAKEFDILLQHVDYEERMFPQLNMAWEPTNYYHFPLYFSDPALERYGHVHHPLIQPFASIGRFGTQFILLPYQMVINPPCKEEYPLGWYRPGDCAPKLHYQIPWNTEAAVVEAGVVTGLFFIIP